MIGESHMGMSSSQVRSFSRVRRDSGISNTRPVIMSTHTRLRCFPGSHILMRSKPSWSEGLDSANQ